MCITDAKCFLQIANAYIRVYEAIGTQSSLKFDILSIYRQ